MWYLIWINENVQDKCRNAVGKIWFLFYNENNLFFCLSTSLFTTFDFFPYSNKIQFSMDQHKNVSGNNKNENKDGHSAWILLLLFFDFFFCKKRKVPTHFGALIFGFAKTTTHKTYELRIFLFLFLLLCTVNIICVFFAVHIFNEVATTGVSTTYLDFYIATYTYIYVLHSEYTYAQKRNNFCHGKPWVNHTHFRAYVEWACKQNNHIKLMLHIYTV